MPTANCSASTKLLLLLCGSSATILDSSSSLPASLLRPVPDLLPLLARLQQPNLLLGIPPPCLLRPSPTSLTSANSSQHIAVFPDDFATVFLHAIDCASLHSIFPSCVRSVSVFLRPCLHENPVACASSSRLSIVRRPPPLAVVSSFAPATLAPAAVSRPPAVACVPAFPILQPTVPNGVLPGLILSHQSRKIHSDNCIQILFFRDRFRRRSFTTADCEIVSGDITAIIKENPIFLAGCVEVVGCLKVEELVCWEAVPESVRLEGHTDFCWLCEKPQKLVIPFEMRGYQGVYNLEKRIYEAAVRGLTPLEGPFPVKFPMPDPENPFSLNPGSLMLSSSKASEVKKSRSVSAAIAGARAAATQFSKKVENRSAVDEQTNTIQKHDNAQNRGSVVADQVNRAAYNLRNNLRKGRDQEDDQALDPEKELMHSGSRESRSHQSELRAAVPPGSSKLFLAALEGMNKNR